MNWDWEKLSQQRQRQTGGPVPGFEDFQRKVQEFKGMRLPGPKVALAAALLLWLLSGIYIVEPDEAGVVLRFGAFHRLTEPGPHYHLPYPLETALTPKVTQVRRLEVGVRSMGDRRQTTGSSGRSVTEESRMLTGDENIVDVQFIVQYQIKDPVDYLFNVADPDEAVRSAAEAGMREVIGKTKIDLALTTGKVEIQNESRDLLQGVLDRYDAGVLVTAVQLQNVHPPEEVSDAFKDVASAREDKSRFINEAEAYRNDVVPRARGQAAAVVNEAEGYREATVRRAQGEASRFAAVLTEYEKSREVTRQRLYLEAMEEILSNPALEKLVLSDEAARKTVPYLPLNQVAPQPRPADKGGN